jgi:hypothetical protein
MKLWFEGLDVNAKRDRSDTFGIPIHALPGFLEMDLQTAGGGQKVAAIKFT